MPPKRKQSDASDSDEPKKKKTAAPKLKKSKLFDHSKNPAWTDLKPDGEWALKCVDRWCLRPPYAVASDEKQWKNYYDERSALDKINTVDSVESKSIVSEELGQDTFEILRAASSRVAATIHGSALLSDDKRVQLARTLMGSLYFLELWGSDEEGGGDNPRTINAKSRLYSPYGLGGSVEFSYDYHYRQFRANERFSTFVAMTRGIGECNPKDPAYCSTTEKNKNGRRKPSEGSIKIFDMNGAKISGTTAKNYEDIEESLFGSTGWLSPLKLFHLACAAGTVMLYHENNAGTVAKAGLDKFKFFQGESDGKGKVQEDIRLLADLEKKEDEPVCVPSRLLLLAKQSG